jgi:hypothetical protein
MNPERSRKEKNNREKISSPLLLFIYVCWLRLDLRLMREEEYILGMGGHFTSI